MADELAVHAIVRNRRTDRALDAIQLRRPAPPYRLVESGELAAAVTDLSPDGPAAPGGDADGVRAHADIVARLLRRSTLIPAPYGLRARDDAAVRVLLETQRVALLDALDFFEDGYELRLHASPRPGEAAGESLERAARFAYENLRHHARAARLLPAGAENRLLSAAFLIARSDWIRFVELVGDWESRSPGLRLDVTGPWAAYDFVELVS
ncbi:MAG: GvpL/GvpF family gas vesicle protein [Gemmatimonadota bacterium]